MEKIIILDTETTGLDTAKDHVVELAIRIGLGDDFTTDIWRIRPPISIPEEVTKIHGISDSDVADCPFFGQVADDVAAIIESADVVVGYNPDFDKDILTAEFERAGRTIKWPAITICPKRMWNIYIQPPRRTLVEAFKEFVDKEGYDGAHGALADVNATVRVLNAQLKRFELEGKPWGEIDPDRGKWVGRTDHLIWKSSYKDGVIVNFGKHKGKNVADVDNGYFRWFEDKNFPEHVKIIFREMQSIRKKNLPNPDQAIALWAKERY